MIGCLVCRILMSGNALIGQWRRIHVWKCSDWSAVSDPVASLSSPCRVLVESLPNPSEMYGKWNPTMSDTCRIPVGYSSDTRYKWPKHHKQGVIKCHVTSQTLYHIISHYSMAYPTRFPNNRTRSSRIVTIK